MPQIVRVHDSILGIRIDLSNGHHVGQDVAELLGVQKVQVLQRRILIM